MKKDISIEELEIIDCYLRNELKGEQLAHFKNELKTNPELQAKTKELQLIRLAIGETDLLEQMDSFHTKESKINTTELKKGKKTPYFKITAVAASLALLIGLLTYTTINRGKGNLYRKYYKPDPGLMTVMSANENYEFQKAMVAYKDGTYNESIEAWQQQLKVLPENDTLIYFLAAAYQANENLDSAKFYLQKIVLKPNSVFYNDANWYIALIYLRQSDKTNALSYLELSRHYQSEALIEEIKNR